MAEDTTGRGWKLPALAGVATLVVALFSIGWAGAKGLEAHWSSSEERVVAALAGGGLGLSPEELRPAFASDGWAALQRAIAVMDAVDEEERWILGDSADIYAGDITLTINYPDQDREAQIASLAQVLLDCEGAIPAIDEALTADGIRFPLEWSEGMNAPLDWLMSTKHLALLLRARALAASTAGHHAAAWAEVERLLALCDRVQEPHLIARLVRHAMVGIGVYAIQQLLRLGPPPAPEVRVRLQAALVELERLPPFHTVLRTELSLSLTTLSGPDGLEVGVGSPLEDSHLRYVPDFLLEAWLARERAALAERMSLVIRAADVPPGQVQGRLAALPRVTFDDGILAAMLEPAYLKAHGKDLRSQAQLRLARLLLDLAALEELPAKLSKPLQDPWSQEGGRLRYRRESPNRAVLWSVSEDQVDDGGVRLGDRQDMDTWDEVLVFERPAGG